MFTEERTLEDIAPEFLEFTKVELAFSAASIIKYRDCLRHVSRILANPPVTGIDRGHITRLKSYCIENRLSTSRQTSFLLSLKRLLRYAGEELRLAVLDPTTIQPPRRPRVQVQFLRPEEVQEFISSIPLTSGGGSVY